MRTVQLFAVSAVLVLGASLAPVDRAQAQGLLEMAPPVDSATRTGQPVKFEIDTPQPPKAGSAIFFPQGAMDVLTPRKKARKAASGTKAK